MEGLDHNFGLLPDDAGASRLDADWLQFCAALGLDAGARSDARAIAGALQRQPECHITATRMLQQIADALGVEPAAAALAGIVSSIIAELPQPTAASLLAGMETAERRQFLRAVVPVFSPPAILTLASAAGAAYGRPLSAPLVRLLDKLRTEADTLPVELRPRADQSFRSLVLHMAETWASAAIDSTATGYDSMFHAQEERRRTRVTPEPIRIVQLSLESGAIGNVVWGAVAEQARSEVGMRELFDMLKRAPATSVAVGPIVSHVGTPARLSALLQEEPVDFAAVDVLTRHMGSNAIRPLLDELIDARLRSTRRALMDRLVALGPVIAPHVAERLDDERWYVVRNMIALLREAGCAVDHVPVARFRAHSDARVRRETLQLQLENEASRDNALVEALRDTDKHVLRTALQAARSHLPESAVPVLASRVTSADFPPEFRVISLFLLGRSGSIQALEALLAFVQGGSSLFGKPKLAAKSPEMLAALGGLARSWPNERRAAVLLELAAKSKDEQILNALHAAPAGR